MTTLEKLATFTLCIAAAIVTTLGYLLWQEAHAYEYLIPEDPDLQHPDPQDPLYTDPSSQAPLT